MGPITAACPADMHVTQPVSPMTDKTTIWVAYWRKKNNPQGHWQPSDHTAWSGGRDAKLAELRERQDWIDWRMVPYRKTR